MEDVSEKVVLYCRHTYVFAMEDTEVQNKILDREKHCNGIHVRKCTYRRYGDDIQCFLIRE